MKYTSEVVVTYKDHMGKDETIIEVARQSTSGAFKGWGSDEKPGDEKLLRFLHEHKHSTPWEFCALHVQVNAPIYVARQIMRHRTCAFSEMSGRYVEMPEEAFVPPSFKVQASKNKQASAEAVEAYIQAAAQEAYRHAIDLSVGTYKDMLASGISKEQARLVLPVSMMTQWRQVANLRNWFHFLGLRLDPHCQDETRLVAEQIAELVKEKWPRSWGLFEESVLA